MAISRRNFLRGSLAGLGTAAAATAISPLIKIKNARAAGNGKRVVIVGIGGGLRLSESLGMAQGPTMPNLLGTTRLVTMPGTQPSSVQIAPGYMAQPLVLPAPRTQPLYTQGTLITNLRYADGPPGHLQGHGCLLSGAYNRIENRADAKLSTPTIFELHRRATNAPATDAWYISMVGGFYRALITSDHPSYGARYAGVYLQPPGAMQPFGPIIAGGHREVNVTGPGNLPTIPSDPTEDAAVMKLTNVLDGNSPMFASDDPIVHLSPNDNAQIQSHLAEVYSDGTFQSYFPESFGIGIQQADGTGIDGTGDTRTIHHAEQVLKKFKPAVMAITLLDIDIAHTDFNGYLRNQQIADACVRHLWDFIQADPELAGTTTMIVMPEHGRHNYFNNNNPDSMGRYGLDHGQGDDGDRDVWMLALGPDVAQNNVIAPTGITQTDRTSGRYETIDAIMTAMSILGHDTVMKDRLVAENERPGLVISEVMA